MPLRLAHLVETLASAASSLSTNDRLFQVLASSLLKQRGQCILQRCCEASMGNFMERAWARGCPGGREYSEGVVWYDWVPGLGRQPREDVAGLQ